MVTYLVQANEEENLLELYDPDSLDLTATLEPYEAAGDESDYNQTYQDMGDLGSATVQEATLAVAVQGLKYAVENGTEMN